jgi:L-fucose isomerase-like protein
MYFPMGGGSLKGVARPGEIVWSRVFVEGGKLHADLGRASVVSLPAEETERRWRQTTYQWPIIHAVLHDVSQVQFMARHRANHINIAYGNDEKTTNQALFVKAAALHELGVNVHLCGDLSSSHL